jgi:hypothetical protein
MKLTNNCKKQKKRLAQVTRACNPYYSGGRDQDCGSKATRAERETFLYNTQHKKGLVG